MKSAWVIGLSLALAPHAGWAGSHSYQYSNGGGPHALTSIDQGGTVYSYDRNGSPLRIQEGSEITSYQYDSSLHLKKQVEPDGTTTRHLYDAEGNKLATVHSDQSVHSYFGSVRILNPSVPGTPSVLINYGEAELTPTQQVDFRLSDHLGSVVAMSDSVGMKEAKDSDPFGGDWYLGTTDSRSLDFTDYGFTSSRVEGKLLDLADRHMKPGSGRLLQADTVIPGPGSFLAYNRYAYVFNNPLKYVDPSGHDPESAYPNQAEVGSGSVAFQGYVNYFNQNAGKETLASTANLLASYKPDVQFVYLAWQKNGKPDGAWLNVRLFWQEVATNMQDFQFFGAPFFRGPQSFRMNNAIGMWFAFHENAARDEENAKLESGDRTAYAPPTLFTKRLAFQFVWGWLGSASNVGKEGWGTYLIEGAYQYLLSEGMIDSPGLKGLPATPEDALLAPLSLKTSFDDAPFGSSLSRLHDPIWPAVKKVYGPSPSPPKYNDAQIDSFRTRHYAMNARDRRVWKQMGPATGMSAQVTSRR